MAIVSFAGQKGGVGKSTFSIATAQEFYERGYKTLLVDIDPQGTVSMWADVAADEDFDVVPVMRMGDNVHKALPKMVDDYDIIIIDCPGRMGLLQKKAMMISDIVIFPMSGDTQERWTIYENFEVVEDVQTFNAKLRPIILLNKLRKMSAETIDTRRALEEKGYAVFESTISRRVAFGRFMSFGVGISAYEPNGKAANEVKQYVNELEGYLEVENGKA